MQASKKRHPNENGHSREGVSSKIHVTVDAYGYPVYLKLSEGQRKDINYLFDYIYENGGEPAISSPKGAKFGRRCVWWLYKECHNEQKLVIFKHVLGGNKN